MAVEVEVVEAVQIASIAERVEEGVLSEIQAILLT
jgi:hypothetical protein